MKADDKRISTRTGRRIVTGLTDAMFALASEQAFERIRVNTICERADYPRATFYNYFSDKYDLLNHCWIRMEQGFAPADYMQAGNGFHALFDHIADLFEQHIDLMHAVLRHDGIEGELMHSLVTYLTARMRQTFRDNGCYHLHGSVDMPQDMMADFCSNTMLLIIRWTFLGASPISHEQAHQLIDDLIIHAVEAR